MSPTPAPAARAGEELPSTEVVVVRHGETAWNASRVVQGQMDPELNEAGRRQAVVVARRLSREAKPAAVYSSDLRRAAETAETIARACGVSNVVLTEALRERHMGYLQGLRWDAAVDKSPDSLHIVKVIEGSDPDSRNQELPGGGESLNQLNERCVCFLNKIAQEHAGNNQRTLLSHLTAPSLPPSESNTTPVSTEPLHYYAVGRGAGGGGLPRRSDTGALPAHRPAGQLRPQARPQHLAQRLPRLRRHRAVGAREVRGRRPSQGRRRRRQLPGGLVRGRRGLGVNVRTGRSAESSHQSSFGSNHSLVPMLFGACIPLFFKKRTNHWSLKR
uniref:Phosphoglycerate mutase-like protein 4 n=1 Tax=Zea mays TaxID=4577 RepID=A0A804NYT1_MAIZE